MSDNIPRKRLKPRVLRVEETEIGRRLTTDPVARAHHDMIVAYFRELARPEIEASDRSERLTGDDLRQMVGNNHV